MSDEELLLEDWKMTKDRIKHFDDLIFRLRLEGIPIASAIIGIGLASSQVTSQIVFTIGSFTLSATSIVILLGALYLIPIFALDWIYYNLLLLAVTHAIDLEKNDKFRNNLQITRTLTHTELTKIHTRVAKTIYILVIMTSVVLAIAINYLPQSS